MNSGPKTKNLTQHPKFCLDRTVSVEKVMHSEVASRLFAGDLIRSPNWKLPPVNHFRFFLGFGLKSRLPVK
jgi:hypothetical protein